MVVTKRQDGAAQRDDGKSGGRIEARNHSQKIAEQNEEAEGGQIGGELFAAVADDFMRLAIDETVGTFKKMLQRARLVD